MAISEEIKESDNHGSPAWVKPWLEEMMREESNILNPNILILLHVQYNARLVLIYTKHNIFPNNNMKKYRDYLQVNNNSRHWVS